MKNCRLVLLLLYCPVLLLAQGTVTSVSESPITTSIPTTTSSTFYPEIKSAEGNSTDNFYNFTPTQTYSKSIANTTVPIEYQNNPDFGLIPFGSSVPNCYEEIQKRTSDERFFRDQSNSSIIYFQKSSGSINYFKDGNWLAIDPRLKMIDKNNYEAAHQPLKCSLNILEQRTKLGEGNNAFGFNHFTMTEYNLTGISSKYDANWNNYTVGDDGIYIHGIFPGIDLKLKYTEGTIKSTFLVQYKRENSSKIVFNDALDLPKGYTVATNMGHAEQHGWQGDLTINDQSGHSQYIYGQIKISDNGTKDLTWLGNYTLSGNMIGLNIFSDVYNDTSIIYPLIIDPTVTYGPFSPAIPTTGAGIAPAFCSNSMVVSIPGGATPTDFSATWSVTNTNNCGCAGASKCNLSGDQLYITSSCGGATPAGAPGVVWTCGCGAAAPANWAPTIPFGSSGCTSMSTCITPSCNPQNITYTVFLNQFHCGNPACGSCVYLTNTCAHLNSWSVTIQAKTLETLGDVTTGNGSTTVTGTCCVNSTLSVLEVNGVPPYTYLWSTGATTSTLVVNSCVNSSTVYTCTVTDACGVARIGTITFSISCPLPIELLNFDATYNGKTVDAKWATASENNNNFFTLERSTDGQSFSIVGVVPTQAVGGNSTSTLFYSYNDPNVSAGTYYYRLKQTDNDAVSKYSNIVPVTILNENEAFSVVPNPAVNSTDIIYYTYDDTPSVIKVFDVTGKIIINQPIQNKRGKNIYTLNLNEFNTGMYFVTLITPTQTHSTKLIKK